MRRSILIAYKTKGVDVSVRFVLGKFLSLGRDAQSVTKPIFEKKPARSHARSRASFEFNVSLAPEERAIAVRDADIRG